MTVGLDLDIGRGCHLLAVADDVAAEEVAALARSWFPGISRLGARALRLAPGALLTGPWPLSNRVRQKLDVPRGGSQVYLLHAPQQRGGPVPEELVNPDGLSGAFRSGAPFGVEAEAVTFLLAAAKRLGGALRVAGSGVVLTPDPESDVNLWVYSHAWLDPDVLTDVLAPVLPSFGVVVGPEGVRPPGPSPELAVSGVPVSGDPNPDRQSPDRQGPDGADVYGALAELGEDGAIEVTVQGEEFVPPVLRGLGWAESAECQVVAYGVRWWAADVMSRHARNPSVHFRAARTRVRTLVERAARVLHAAVGGEITDDAGFLVDPDSLA